MGFLLGQPFAEMTVGRFGGLYTEADERDLPLGASPLNHDVDFLIGGVGIRPGLTAQLGIGSGLTVPYLKSTRITPAFSPPIDATLYETSAGQITQIGDGNVVPFFPGDSAVISNAIATSENFENTEFIALSNFGPEVVNPLTGLVTNGYDQPRTYTGTNVGRVSQCGPSDDFFSAVGTGTGSGQLAAGTRYCIYMFLMADGSITPASPPSQFTTTSTEIGIIFTNVGIGPRNCVGRIVALTLANAGIGGPYYYIPNAVSGSGGPFGPTVINDNTTTTLTAVLSDTVITAGINLSVVGGNILQMREIGEYVKAVSYAGRMFYLGERTKVDNIPNLTFDGNGAFPAFWGISTPPPTFSVIRSLIYGMTLSFKNPTGSTINPTLGSPTYFLFRNDSALDPFGAPRYQNNLDYSVRITAYTDALGVGATCALTLSGGSLISSSSVQTAPLTQTPQEFILDFENNGSAFGANFKLYPVNLPGNATLFVDRIEPFPTESPIYSTQLSASYLLNNGVLGDPQCVDAITGRIDASLFTTRPLKDQFVFPNNNSLYFATEERMFQTQVAAGSEPSGWGVTEITGAGGVAGPLADDVGEAWVIYANRQGVYIFDGGTPQKISQEIQQLWSKLYFPSLNRIWVKIDLYQQRVLVGVPMVTPNKWMPDAPANATPATPNVILCMSYLGLSTAAEIADAAGVHPSSFTGQLLSRDQTRKWTAWTISSPVANWINQSAAAQQLWLGGTGTGKIYVLDGSNQTDDGAAIPEKYTTFGFADEMQSQGLQLGSVRKQYAYMTATLEGAGGAILTTYPENLETPYANSQPAVTLANPALDDVNLPLNETGNYLFLQLKTDGNPGSYFNLRRMVVGVMREPSIPISGT
jgi:hypothetical protein